MLRPREGSSPARPAPALNAIGKPFGANYAPAYRMRYRTPALKRTMGRFPAITPERWLVMVEEARKAWEARAEAEAKMEAEAAAKLAA